MVVNREFNDPRFGIIERKVVIEKGRNSQLQQIKLPMLNKEVPFAPVEVGKVNTYAGGELTLDLTDASATFPNGSHSGLIHVSFEQIGNVDVIPSAKAYPLALYSIQPAGVKVTGELSLKIKMPKLYNSHSYVPDSGTYVVLVGRDNLSNSLQPIGVGQIDGYTVKSVGAIHLKRLDYIGYAFVEENKQSVLEQYANGQSSIQALKGAL